MEGKRGRTEVGRMMMRVKMAEKIGLEGDEDEDERVVVFLSAFNTQYLDGRR